jgi:transposase-like protein
MVYGAAARLAGARRVEGPRTTNALERINREFRRCTKTHASLPGSEAVGRR